MKLVHALTIEILAGQCIQAKGLFEGSQLSLIKCHKRQKELSEFEFTANGGFSYQSIRISKRSDLCVSTVELLLGSAVFLGNCSDPSLFRIFQLSGRGFNVFNTGKFIGLNSEYLQIVTTSTSIKLNDVSITSQIGLGSLSVSAKLLKSPIIKVSSKRPIWAIIANGQNLYVQLQSEPRVCIESPACKNGAIPRLGFCSNSQNVTISDFRSQLKFNQCINYYVTIDQSVTLQSYESDGFDLF